MREWIEIEIQELAAKGMNIPSFVDGDWIESEYISNEGIRIIQTGNIGIGEFLDKPNNKKYISKESFDKLNCKKVFPNDLLICRLADPIGRVCQVPDRDEFYVTAVDVIILRPDDIHFPTFIKYILNSDPVLKEANDKSGGSTRQRVSRKNYGKLKIKIPSSKNEQATIAKVLSTVDQAIDQTEKLIAKYERIKTGLMQDLLTKGIDEQGNIRSEESHEFKDSPLGRIPVEWEVGKLGNWVKLKGGNAFRSKDFQKAGIQLIRIGNLFNNQLDLNRSPVYLPEEFKRIYKDYLLSRGDIILSMTGTYGKRDYGFAIMIDSGNFLLNQRVCKFIIDEKRVKNSFLLYLLRSEKYLDELFKSVTGSKQGNLKNSNILNVSVGMPCNDEQIRISQKINQCYKIISTEKKTKYKLVKQKTALMQDLLTNKVSVEPLMQKEAIII